MILIGEMFYLNEEENCGVKKLGKWNGRDIIDEEKCGAKKHPENECF